MGWTSAPTWKTKRDVINAILRECYGATSQVIETKSTASGLWVLARPKGGPVQIDLWVIETHSAGNSAYKGMTESMHPYFYDCPLAFLDEAPEACAAWRAEVRAQHARKGITFANGDDVTIHGERYTVVAPYKRSWLVRDASGKQYKARAKDMHLTADVERAAREERERVMAAPYKVICAFGDWHKDVPAGKVGVILTRDGNRQRIGDEIRVLVSADVYDPGYALTGDETPWTAEI